MAFGLSTIGQVGIAVSDVARAVVFYRDILGIRFLFQTPNIAFFDSGGIRLMLATGSGNESNHPAICYRVSDIHSATELLRSRGVIFERDPHRVAIMPDHDLWMALFRDQDQNLLALMCEKAGALTPNLARELA